MKLFNMYHFWKYALVRPTQWRPTQWMDWVEAPKHFPKPHLQEKNVMVNTRTNPLQLSESHRNYCIWGSCSANQQDAPKTARLAASTGPQKGPSSSPWQCPTAHHTTNTSKVEWIGLRHFHQQYSPHLLPTDHHFFKHLGNFLQGKCFLNQKDAKSAVQEFVISWSMDFFFSAIGINKHFSLAKMQWFKWFLFLLINICFSLVIMI